MGKRDKFEETVPEQKETSDIVSQQLAKMTYELGPQVTSLVANGTLPTVQEIAEVIKKKGVSVEVKTALEEILYQYAFIILTRSINETLRSGVTQQSLSSFKAVLQLVNKGKE